MLEPREFKVGLVDLKEFKGYEGLVLAQHLEKKALQKG